MANQKDYTQLAKDIVRLVGGRENIISLTNCITRLRFVLKDDTKPDAEALKALSEVKGVMNQGGQYQVIIGQTVNQVAEFVKKEAGLNDDSSIHEAPKEKGIKGIFNSFFKTISGSIMPMLGLMIAGGIIKGVLTILTTTGFLATADGTYQILYAAANAPLYFMPILVGFTCGKLFNANPYTLAVIGAALIYPDLLTAVNAEGGIRFLGISVQAATYANTFLPILLAGFVAAKLEKLGKKIIPSMMQMMLVPTFVLVITVPLAWLVIGPIMNTVSSVLASAVNTVFNFSPLIGGLLVGAFWQLMVVLGLHYAFIPILMNNFFTTGSDPVNAVMGLTVWALIGVALGYAMKVKDPEEKATGFGSFASALCGVTEPTIYSIALPNIKLFGCAWIGGGLAGAILGSLGGRMYNFGGDGLFRIPAMINPEGIDISFYGFIGCALLAAVVSGVLAYIMTPAKKETNAVLKSSGELIEEKITAIADGSVIDITTVNDEMFAGKVMGDGIAFRFEGDKVTLCSPSDGTLSVLFPTGHAFGITTPSGKELLVHCGINTVDANGKGFTVLNKKQGDLVKEGDPIVEVDLAELSRTYDMTTMLIVTAGNDGLQFIEPRTVSKGDSVIL